MFLRTSLHRTLHNYVLALADGDSGLNSDGNNNDYKWLHICQVSYMFHIHYLIKCFPSNPCESGATIFSILQIIMV